MEKGPESGSIPENEPEITFEVDANKMPTKSGEQEISAYTLQSGDPEFDNMVKKVGGDEALLFHVNEDVEGMHDEEQKRKAEELKIRLSSSEIQQKIRELHEQKVQESETIEKRIDELREELDKLEEKSGEIDTEYMDKFNNL